ncbi:MAG: NapC/NirT family cytochrome c [Polaromonas sp.]
MTDNLDAPVKTGLAKLRVTLLRPAARYSILSLLLIGFFAGLVGFGGFHAGLDATNTTQFCISCHEMNDTVYQEYRTTVHYSNRTGVRAGCPDCHVPKELGNKLIAKVKASHDIWASLTGSINTKEKFEARRMTLAQNQWTKMKASDSRECRNCHVFEGMDAKKQRPSAQKKHAGASQEGKTCIDCHKGIAHLLPKEYKEEDEE